MLSNDPDRAYYGFNHCRRALDAGGIAVLMVSDNLFRAATVATRRQYVQLVEETKEAGGRVLIFSAMHQSGEDLAKISGVAAILRFPMPDIESDDDDDY